LDRDARRRQREAEAAERASKLARRRPLAREVAEIEKRIAALEAERRGLEAQLADTAFYAAGNVAEVQAATRRCTEVARLIEAAEERWLAAQSELEAIGEP
ncbi:MAG: hypothetical protein WBO04_05875, partial [Steroidobacteraceae bacterium]